MRILILGLRTFYDNKSGYPVLHKEHKALITKYMQLRSPPWVILWDVAAIPGADNPEELTTPATGTVHPLAVSDALNFPPLAESSTSDRPLPKQIEPLHFLNLLRRLQQEQPSKSMVERFSSGYQDYLQAPLQPLTDNLESITYEVFEKDPVKYALYAEAIERALLDWRQGDKPASGPQGKVVLAVVGAGRGPLVSRALQASERSGVPIELWALEKNPNAFVLLERHNMSFWENQVHLVRSDMRSWRGPSRLSNTSQQGNGNTNIASQDRAMGQTHFYSIDILVSELLGSFADNELSPECLDGITPLLNPIHGLSIPYSYTSYLTPIAAPKLHADILTRAVTDKEAPVTPYVVMLQAVDYISTKTEENLPARPSSDASITVTMQQLPQVAPAWSFYHGGRSVRTMDSNEHNTRQARMSFRSKDRAVCHGLAGFFEAVLYPGVELSTHPHTAEDKSAGMMSWFPIFFPLQVGIARLFPPYILLLV